MPILAEVWSAVSSSSGSGAAPVPLTLTGGFSLPFFTSNVPEDQQPVQALALTLTLTPTLSQSQSLT